MAQATQLQRDRSQQRNTLLNPEFRPVPTPKAATNDDVIQIILLMIDQKVEISKIPVIFALWYGLGVKRA